MTIYTAKTIVATLEMAQLNSKYNTKKNKLNKKWVRFLKNKKLFDEYMVYLAGHEAIGVEPKNYKQLSNVCHNLSNHGYKFYGASLRVDWVVIFNEFMEDSIKWYNIKERILRKINNNYK